MKEKKERFVLELPLKTQIFQENILDKRLEICRRLYNQLVQKYNMTYQEMIKTKKYRSIQEELKALHELKTDSDKKNKIRGKREKELYQILNDMYKEYGFTDFSMRSMAGKQRNPYKKNIDSQTAQKIGARLWTAWDRFLYGDGRMIHFCKYGNYNSVEGSSNKSGIRIKKDAVSKKNVWSGETPLALFWNGLEIPIAVNTNKPYEVEALENEVAYNRIVRRFVRGKYKYYVQIVLKGTPPVKYNLKTGELKHPIGNGPVGIDMGTQILAAVSKDDLLLVELAERVKIKDIEKEKAELNRKMDRSRRAMNPDNYNADGTIKKQGSKKVVWKKSNHYIKLQEQLKELERKQAAIRKYQHYELVNMLLALGNEFYIEDKDIKQMQMKKPLEQKDDGSYKSRSNYGKSIAEKAPSIFITLLKQKAELYGGEVIVIDKNSVKASQYSHITDDFHKKEVSERYDKISKCQKNLYTAFLLMNVEDKKHISREKCNQNFPEFKERHDKTLELLKQNTDTTFPKSMGI